jgi:hypothetical protein
MNKTLLAVALVALMGGAYAGTDKDTGEVCQGSTCNGGGGGGAGGSSEATGIGVGVGIGYANSRSRAVNNTQVNVNAGSAGGGGGTYRVKNVPTAVAPSIDPTAPCAIPVSGGGSGVGFGVSFGSAYVDEGCEMRELIRIGLTSGNAVAEDKAAQLLNRQLDEALAESDEAVASGPVSESSAWAWQTND